MLRGSRCWECDAVTPSIAEGIGGFDCVGDERDIKQGARLGMVVIEPNADGEIQR